MNRDGLKKKYKNHILKPVIDRIRIDRGDGVKLYDYKGKEYLDFTAGFAVSQLGYGNESVKDSVIAQLNKFSHCPHYLYYSAPVARLAKRLSEITPEDLVKTFFTNSASEAVEGAIRTSRKYKNGFELMSIQKSFFGRTMGAVSLTGQKNDKKGAGPLLTGVHHIPAPYCYRCSFGLEYPDCDIKCADYTQEIIDFSSSGNIAALFFEPILADGGVVVPPEGYFERLFDICAENEIAIVVDETITGFCRTGKMFGSQHWGIEPDIMIMGKALGGGLPLGAFIVSNQVASCFDFEDFSSTLGGNPVACEAGLAMIDKLEQENIGEHVGEVGSYIIEQLEELKTIHDEVGDVRGKGLLIGIEIINPRNNEADSQKAQDIKDMLVGQGVLVTVYGKSTLRLTPPLTIEKKHVDSFIEKLNYVLNFCQ